MKNKLILGMVAIFGLAFTHPKATLTVLLAGSTKIVSAQFFPSVNSDGSYTIAKAMSPTNTYGNRWDVLKITNDTFMVRSKYIIFDSIGHNSSIPSSNLMVSVNSLGRVSTTTFSNISLPYSQLTGTPTIYPPTSYTAGNGINITSNVISLTANTTNTVTRPINSTSYTISASQDQIVNYNVFAQVTSALVGNNTAYLYLETSPNNSTWTTIAQSGIGVSGLVSTMGNTQTLTGTVLKGYWVRIRQVATGANSGSAVFTYQSGNETPK